MATLKDIKRKITAVKKTQKITKAMNMVAASKLRGAQEKMEAFRHYANKFAEVLGSLAERIEIGEENAPPLLVPRGEVKTVDLLLMTSDRGLCGSFNTHLLHAGEKFLKARAEQGVQTRLICMGRKGRDYFRRRKMNIIDVQIGVVGGRFGFNAAINAGRKVIDDFLGGQTDEVYMLFSDRRAVLRIPGHSEDECYFEDLHQRGDASRHPHQTTREKTITLYIDKEAFRRALDIPHEETIWVLVLDRQGNVLWRTEGAYDQRKRRRPLERSPGAYPWD